MSDNRLQAVDAGEAVGVEYESVHSDVTADKKSEFLTVVDASYSTSVVAQNDDGERFTLRLDGDVVTEIAKHDSHDNPRRVGFPVRVTRLGWV